jgi:DNA topoisomerase-3
MAIKFDEETKNYKLEFDFGDDKAGEDSGELVDFSAQTSLGACRKCGAGVYEHGKNYVCEKSVPTAAQPTPSCDFKSGQIILQQPIEPAQMRKLLETGKTDLLDKFVSTRTRRAFKAMLAWDPEAGKVNFEFAPSKFPPRKTAYTAAAAGAAAKKTPAAAAKKVAAKTTKTANTTKATKTTPTPKAPKAASTTPKAPRQASAATNKQPSAALAAVIGNEPLARPQVIKKLWDYIKANGLQDAADKRAINADDKLLAVFGKNQVTMFELAGLVGKHLS